MADDKEIEIKLNYSNRNLLIKKLLELGAEKTAEYALQDEYFGNASATMSNSNSIVRIRCKGNECEMTYKGKCRDEEGIWTRKEITTKIGNAASAKEILLGSGLISLSINKSCREFYSLNGCEIAFIDFIFPDKMSIVEIEGPDILTVKNIRDSLGQLVSETGESAFHKFDKKKQSSQ